MDAATSYQSHLVRIALATDDPLKADKYIGG